MNDTSDLLERVGDRFPFPADAFERLEHRRDAKRRNRRIAAATVGLLVTALGIGVAIRLATNDRTSVPAVPTDVRNGGISVVAGDPPPGDLILVDPGTGARTVLVRGCASGTCDGAIESVDWSPDGTRIAYALQSGTGEDTGIYVLDRSSGETTRLTSCSDPCTLQTDLDWSPLGDRIAFTQHIGGTCTRASNFDGSCSIFVVGTDGSAPVELPTGIVATDPTHPSWSPDGSEIAFSARSGDEWFVYRMSATDGTGPVPLTTTERFMAAPAQPAWSPDGSAIAFLVTDARTDYTQLWTIAADGSDLTFLKDLGCCSEGGSAPGPRPAWSPDGTQIALNALAGGHTHLWILDRSGSLLEEFDETIWAPPSWQPRP